ncbi:MAG TPA: TadE family protein [Bryobacteraceae bacterium]|nr:TadE family protein [Bryobacteraceae bacterium]
MSRRRGGVAIEFALSFSALWAILSGAVEFGYSFYVYNTLASAVNGGAMLASHLPFESPGANFGDTVKKMVVYGSPAGEAGPLAPGLAMANVVVKWERDAGGVPQTITVSIQDYQIRALFRTYMLSDRPRMTVRYMGLYQISPV